MTGLRHHLRQHRALFALMFTLTLFMRVVMPAGFMPVVGGNAITIALCTGYGPQTIAIALAGKDAGDHQHDKSGDSAPCAFAGLAAPLLSGADPVLLAQAILFILLLAIQMPIVQRTAPPLYLRPPLRGPPRAC